MCVSVKIERSDESAMKCIHSTRSQFKSGHARLHSEHKLADGKQVWPHLYPKIYTQAVENYTIVEFCTPLNSMS